MKPNPLLTVVATAALLATGVLAYAADRATVGDAPANHQDLQITENVKDKLQRDEPSIAPSITVTTHDGVVTLTGVALTQDYIVKAGFDARSVAGVVEVKNELSLS
ncbi:MAG: BON domain-containing protein [Steroidobacteraceae bacterium]